MKRKKMLFPLIKLGSGADVHFNLLAKEFANKGYDIKFTFYPRIFIHFPFLLKFFRKKSDADIINTTAELGLAFKEKNKKLIISVLHIPKKTEYFNPGFIKTLYYNYWIIPQMRRSIEIADTVYVNSEYTKREVNKIARRKVIPR